MKISARNQFKGTIVKIEEGVVTALVVSDIGNGNKITSTISLAALKDLDLKVGSEVTSVIKASSVLLFAE